MSSTAPARMTLAAHPGTTGTTRSSVAARSDPGLKPYPCCGSTHLSVGRMIDLATRHDLDSRPGRLYLSSCCTPDACRTPTTPTRALRSPPNPATSTSVPFATLKDRAVRLSAFEGDAHLDPTVRAQMARVILKPHPDMPEDWGTEVIVETTDGNRFSSRAGRLPFRRPRRRPDDPRRTLDEICRLRGTQPASRQPAGGVRHADAYWLPPQCRRSDRAAVCLTHFPCIGGPKDA